MSLYAGEDVILPVNPSLSSTMVVTLPSLTVNQDLSSNDSQVEVIKQSPSVVLSEGLPPITTKLLWIYQAYCLVTLQSRVTLLLLLMRAMQHLLVVNPQSQFNRCKKQISDLPTWIQAFSIYAAGLAAASSTTK